MNDKKKSAIVCIEFFVVLKLQTLNRIVEDNQLLAIMNIFYAFMFKYFVEMLCVKELLTILAVNFHRIRFNG
jgi:hypothetical protein